MAAMSGKARASIWVAVITTVVAHKGIKIRLGIELSPLTPDHDDFAVFLVLPGHGTPAADEGQEMIRDCRPFPP